jgi:hypothetical protein
MHRKILATAFGLFGSVSFAATPVASVSTSQPFTLDGHSVSAKGVDSWPLVVGDEVATSTSPATISFRDGSSIALAAKSDAKIAGTFAEPVFLLVSGSLDYNLAKNSKVSVTKLQQPAKHNKARVAAVAAAITPAVVVASANATTAGTLASAPAASASAPAASASAVPDAAAVASTPGSGDVAAPSLLRLPPISQHQ